jgi:hypothetical protein
MLMSGETVTINITRPDETIDMLNTTANSSGGFMVVNLFDNTDVKVKILTLILQFFLIYVATILFAS